MGLLKFVERLIAPYLMHSSAFKDKAIAWWSLQDICHIVYVLEEPPQVRHLRLPTPSTAAPNVVRLPICELRLQIKCSVYGSRRGRSLVPTFTLFSTRCKLLHTHI